MSTKENTVNKQELAAKVADRADLDPKQAAAAVSATLNIIQETLAAGGQVAITGFGGFKTRATPAKSRFNHLAGRVVDTPAKTVVTFKPGSNLAAAVNTATAKAA
ncbi:HU family DNA-binding protein [Nonomuraea sp. MTCD27]|uniref:HU family DNA-binding protein n=1 Tax=Nonomuraea sp. MTCD27 TaxID=1676747 RepID=UPI0035C08B1D